MAKNSLIWPNAHAKYKSVNLFRVNVHQISE